MPELPEVQTTVNGLNAEVKGLRITAVWTSYNSPFHKGKDNIKNPKYFEMFRKAVIGASVVASERQGKNVLIHLSNNMTILAHMKMTGHFMYGKYVQVKKQVKVGKKKNVKSDAQYEWKPENKNGALADPFNRHIRLLFSLSNGHHLAFADTRKFAKVFIFESNKRSDVSDLKILGPDPTSKVFSLAEMKSRLMLRKNWKIKQALLDQEIISGIGNIYSDEMLWSAGIHPLSIVAKIPELKLKKLFIEMKSVLKKGLDFGGDSTSDYRNIYGEPGKFHHKHNVYRRKGETCLKNDGGTIKRIVIGGRSTHFCPKHQVLYI